MLKLQFVSLAMIVSVALAGYPAQAQTFRTLHDFTATPDGREPVGGLIAVGGALYGTTNAGGDVDAGTIYRIDPASGEESVLYSFAGAFGSNVDGSAPQGELVESGGLLYGTTSFGGTFSGGTVFSFDPASGAETLFYSFGAGADGTTPAAGLVVVDGRLFGTTSSGGAFGAGTVFSLDLVTGIETIVHDFSGGDDGAAPFAPLVRGGRFLYGTTFFGGPSNNGTVFRIDPRTGAESVLHAFDGPAFSGNPAAGLVFHHGILYGTTAHGGTDHCGTGCGTVFAIDAATGTATQLYAFASRRDGSDPEGGLVFHHGILYGATMNGGRDDLGTLFSLDVATREKTTLHEFTGRAPGINPGTLLGYRGALYGTTRGGGGAGQGTLFSLAP